MTEVLKLLVANPDGLVCVAVVVIVVAWAIPPIVRSFGMAVGYARFGVAAEKGNDDGEGE